MTLTFRALLDTPTTKYHVQPGAEFLSNQYFASENARRVSSTKQEGL